MTKIEQGPAQTVGKAALILQIIASNYEQELRLIDVAEKADLTKSTAHRLLQRLLMERLLVRDPIRGYRLGPLIYELGLAALPETNLREVSRNKLQELAQLTGDMVFLVERSGYESVCLSRIAGYFPIQTMTRTEGDRHPLGIGAGGLAILAAMHDEEIKTVLRAIRPRLPAYQLSKEKIWQAIHDTRQRRGIAVDAGRAALDVTAIGQAIFSRGKIPVASVFVASIAHRMTDKRQKEVAQLIGRCVVSIEEYLRQ